MSSHNITLTGMPGAGKSTVGVILAKELSMDFIDTDILIQTNEGMTLQEIIDTCSLDTFLKLEEKYVTGLDPTGAIIAPGGSIIYSRKAMTFLKQSGIIIFLNVPIEIIKKRIDIYTRGIVKQPGETIEDVWRLRESLYKKYADVTIECGRMNQMEIAHFISKKFGE